ncbi:phage tail tape measure protein [Roseomonas sp. F4]
MAVVNRRFQAIITVLDRTAGPLRGIQRNIAGLARFTAGVAQPLRSIQERFAALREASPVLNQVGESAALVGRRMAGLAGAVRGVGFGIIGLGAAAGLSAGGLLAMVRATIDQTGALDDLANRLGISANALSGLQYAAQLAGVPAEALGSSLERLQRGLAEAAAGNNDNLAALFRRLGISLRDSNGRLRTAADIMPQLADGFARNTNAATRTRMAMALFGRAGGPLINVLRGGSDALREQMAEWERLHGTVGNDAVQAQAEMGDSLDRVSTAIGGVRFALASRLAPVMIPLLDRLATWISNNRELIATRVAEWAERIGTAIANWDIGALVERLGRWAETAAAITEALGGLQSVLAIMAGLALLPVVSALASLAVSLTALGVSALVFSPAGAVIAALAALALLGKLLYDAWKPFADLVDRIIDGLRRLQGAGVARPPEMQQEQRNNFGQRGRLNGFYDGPAVEPEDPPNPLRIRPGTPLGNLQRLPLGPLLGPDGQPALGGPLRLQSAPGAVPARGQVDVRVRFDDLPRGARVEADGRGDVGRPQLDVGYAVLGVPAQ